MRMVENGIRLDDRESGAVLRIYKEKPNSYYTLVTDEKGGQATIITAYESSAWQIEQYHKVKKHERPKIHRR